MQGKPGNEHQKAPVAKRIVKILGKTILFLLLFIVVVLVLIQTEPVQNVIRGRVQSWLRGKLHTRFDVGRIYIKFPKSVVIENLFVGDRQKDTLLSGKYISADISMYKLLHGEIELNTVVLKGITAKINRSLPDTVFNFQFIADAFTSKKTTAQKTDTGSMKINIHAVTIDQSRFTLRDAKTGNDLVVDIEHFFTDIRQFDLPHQSFDLASLDLHGLTGSYHQLSPLLVVHPEQLDSANASPLLLKLNKINLQKIIFSYVSDPQVMKLQVNAGSLQLNSGEFDQSIKKINIPGLLLNEVHTQFVQGKTKSALLPLAKPDSTTNNDAGWRILAGSLDLKNNSFSYADENFAATPSGIDYHHLHLQRININVSKLLYAKDSISADIHAASLEEQRGFMLTRLSASVLSTNNEIRLTDLDLKTANSILNRNLRVSFHSLRELQKNPGSARVALDIPGSQIAVKDILLFAPQLAKQPLFRNTASVIRLNTQVTGQLNNLSVKTFSVQLPPSSADLNGTITGLPDINKMNLNLKIKRIHTTASALTDLLPSSALPDNLKLPDQMDLAGTIQGNLRAIKTDLSLSGTDGSVHLTGTLASLDKPKQLVYHATISTDQLDIGKLMSNPHAGKISLQIRANGTGIDPHTADATAEGNIRSVTWDNYTFHQFQFKATVKEQKLNANFSLKDPAADLTFDGNADFSSAYPSASFHLLIDTLDAFALHLLKDSLAYHGDLIANFTSTNPDSLLGSLAVTGSRIHRGNKKLFLDSILLDASASDTGRKIQLKSDIVNASLDGKYRLSQMGDVFAQLFDPYFNTSDSNKMIRTDDYAFRVSASVQNARLIKQVLPDLERLDPITLNGYFSREKGWNATAKVPLVIYGDYHIKNFTADAGPDKKRMHVAVNLEEFSSGKSLVFYHTGIDAGIADNRIDFVLDIKDKSSKEKYHLGGLYTKLDKNKYALQLKPEGLLLNYQKWSLNANNRVLLDSTSIVAKNLRLSNGNQSLSINTREGNADGPLEIAFKQFQISTLVAFIQPDTTLANGLLNGTTVIRGLPKNPVINADMQIKNLSFKGDTLGDIALKVEDADKTNLKTEVKISGQGNNIVLNGNYRLNNRENPLDFLLDIQELKLHTIQGLSFGALKRADGSLEGKLKITGALAKPVLDGELTFNKAGVTPAMLSSYFRIDQEKIQFKSHGVQFDSFTILDSTGNKLVLNGSVNSTDYRHFNFDMAITARNFQALNSVKQDNRLYYGTLFFNTNLHIQGTETKPTVDGYVKINEKSKLTITLPQQDPEIADRDGVVRFTDKNHPPVDSLPNSLDSLNSSTIQGFDISTNILVDKNAELTLVIDESNGDYLRVKGEANLNGGIDPSGKVNLTGDYQLDEGTYELSLNFLHKKFDIQKGSKITWVGEPTKANLDINAMYVANTSAIDLVENELDPANTAVKNMYRQKLPFQVHLKLTGELLKPNVAFDVILPENGNYYISHDIINAVETKLTLLRSDQSEMNKQVFALLLLNRFVGQDPFSSSSGGTNAEAIARQSVSKLLTEQLNQLAGSLIKGVDLNFDVQSAQDYSTGQLQNRTDLNVALSKRLLNDRLTVTVGSNFELEGPQSANDQSSNLAGNIALDYKLSKDGRYLIRAYRKNEYEGVLDGYIVETGIGFIITMDYNKFSQIFHPGKKRRQNAAGNKKPPPVENRNTPPTVTGEKTSG